MTEFTPYNPYKSTAAAILLSFFLGSFGLLYASFTAGLVLTIAAIAGLAIPKVGPVIFFLCWLIGPFVAVNRVQAHNRKILHQAS